MTRVTTVSDLKGSGHANQKTPDGKPREGSKIRRMYDALRRGETILRGEWGGHSTSLLIETLRNNWGMQIASSGRKGYRLIGEWEGPYFVPLERILQEDQT